jgi:putative endonuclease
MNTRQLGTSGEEIASHFLEALGFLILQRNFRFGRGEIDLIAQEGQELVFVEVKLRRGSDFGPPEDSITPSKRRQLRRVAEGYLYVNKIEGRCCRFDVVAIEEHGPRVEIRHLKNAF